MINIMAFNYYEPTTLNLTEGNIINSKPFKKKIYCANCGKYGHLYKNCNEPIISLGIICFKIDKDIDYQNYKSIDPHEFESINILKENYKKFNNVKYISKFMNKVKFLLIRRKHTLGYIEFIRGNYEVNDFDHLVSLFQQMTPEEINKIKMNDFEYLWLDLWKNPNKNKSMFRDDYDKSKDKFTKLLDKDDNLIDLSFYTNHVPPKYNEPEWGFPKGRRNYHERNNVCAEREFCEETGYTEEDYIFLNKIAPLSETFYGTNKVEYKHIYYISKMNSNKEPTLDPTNHHQIDEIGDIGWFTYTEVIGLLRWYHVERRKLLNDLFLFILNDYIGKN